MDEIDTSLIFWKLLSLDITDRGIFISHALIYGLILPSENTNIYRKPQSTYLIKNLFFPYENSQLGTGKNIFGDDFEEFKPQSAPFLESDTVVDIHRYN